MRHKKSLFAILIILGFINYSISAQECGTEVSNLQIEFLSKSIDERQNFDPISWKLRNNQSGYSWIPIQIHDFTNAQGTDRLSYFFIDQCIIALNDWFEPMGIQFFECANENVKYDAQLFDFDSAEEYLLANHDVQNVINIYFFNSVSVNNTPVCGYSYLPPSVDRVILSKYTPCILTEEVFLHEIGHYLSLYHTHGKTGTSGTLELVTRGANANCSYEGDDLCDTPADPGLSIYGSGCSYTNTTLTDANGDIYTPLTNNIMSYAQINCKTDFTQGQLARMAYSVLNDRSYLTGCTHPASCNSPVNSFPFVVDFETGFQGWYNKDDFAGNPFYTMSIGSGTTPTQSTGPSSAFQGQSYAFIEANENNGTGGYFSLASPCLDLRNLNAPELSFYIHAFGNNIMDLVAQISLDGGISWEFSPSLLWQTYGSQGNQWINVVANLSAYKSYPFVQIRIAGSINGEEGDVSLDQIQIYDANPPQCTLQLILDSSDVNCSGEANGWASVDLLSTFTAPLNIQWSNGETDPQIYSLVPGTYSVTVTDNNSCSGIGSITINEPPMISILEQVTDETAPSAGDGMVELLITGGVSPYSYTWSNGNQTAINSNLGAGTYSYTVTDNNGCTQSGTVGISTQLVCDKKHSNFPYTHSFESGLGLFKQEQDLDDRNWRRKSGPTSTSGTGPSSAFEGNYYRYVESSGSKNNPGKTSVLKTKKCIDLTGVNNPVFEFYYHMYGNTMGTLEVQLSLDLGNTWIPIWSNSGSVGNQWNLASLDLSNYKTDHTHLRWVGTTGNGSKSDIAIDDYYIGEAGGNLFIIEKNSYELTKSTQLDMIIFPNPSTDILNIRTNERIENGKITVSNLIGETIKQKAVNGNDSFEIVTYDLLPGTYIISLIENEKRVVRKFVKL